MNKSHKPLLALLAAIITLATLPAATRAQSDPVDGVLAGEYLEECQQIDETELRAELNRVAQTAIAQNDIEIAQIVSRQWILLDVDAAIDAEVDAAIEYVAEEETYWNRFLSGWNKGKAEEIAEQVANRAFGSEAFSAKIEELSTAVANEVAAEVELVAVQTASSSLLCLEEFIRAQYSSTMIDLFVDELNQEFAALELEEATADVSLLEVHSRGLAGIGVIIGSQIAKRILRRLTQRIAGKIVGRVLGKAATTLVPVAGWVVGIALIGWDLWEGGKGALPQIQEALKGDDIKAEIRNEVVLAVEPELRRELPQAAADIANDVYADWRQFRDAYDRVLKLADDNPIFRDVLSRVDASNVGNLAALIETTSRTLNEAELQAALESGDFERLLYLPPEAMTILDRTDSVTATVAWADLAGGQLDEVVEHEIYKLRDPLDLDRQQLTDLLDLGDDAAISSLLLTEQSSVDALLSLPEDALVSLAPRLTPNQLGWLASYTGDLDITRRNVLVSRVLEQPDLMATLADGETKSLLLESADLSAALGLLGAPATWQQGMGDALSVANGSVAWPLAVAKYGNVAYGVVGVAGLLLVLLALLVLQPVLRVASIFSPRKRRPSPSENQKAPDPTADPAPPAYPTPAQRPRTQRPPANPLTPRAQPPRAQPSSAPPPRPATPPPTSPRSQTPPPPAAPRPRPFPRPANPSSQPRPQPQPKPPARPQQPPAARPNPLQPRRRPPSPPRE